MKKLVLSMAAAACLVGAMLTTAGAADEQAVVDVTSNVTSYTVSTPTKLVVSGDVTLTGTGDAFTINADTTLEFAEGASLTLNGYDNGFVVENATLSGGGWNITDGDGMDLFRLKNSGELNITGNVDLNGHGKTDTTSRAIVLPGSSSGQAVTLGENVTLSANNFYRGVETGGASTYTISGMDMNTSVFDFSGNDCGMFISYFDSNVNFTQCKLEVSNCTTSGIFMRQDNASLNGLYIDEVYINCENSSGFEQGDIAVRFHTVNFEITDSVINIENACNTGLWIFDGWERTGQKEITNTDIIIQGVDSSPNTSIVQAAMRRKAITFVPYGEWTVSGCTITMEGSEDEPIEGGLNIGNGTNINRDFLTFTAVPTMYGGTIKLQDTEINTAYLTEADIGVQVGQFLEIGSDVVINNDHQTNPLWDNSIADIKHYTVLCDRIKDDFIISIFGANLHAAYDVGNMADEYKVDERVVVTGGSYWSEDDKFEVFGVEAYDCSIPVNADSEKLTMFTISPTAYSTYAENGSIEILRNDGSTTYDYGVANASNDNYRYIWAPAVTVTFEGVEDTYTVPRGTAFGLVNDIMPAGTWTYNDTPFTMDTVVSENITVSAQ